MEFCEKIKQNLKTDFLQNQNQFDLTSVSSMCRTELQTDNQSEQRNMRLCSDWPVGVRLRFPLVSRLD